MGDPSTHTADPMLNSCHPLIIKNTDGHPARDCLTGPAEPARGRTRGSVPGRCVPSVLPPPPKPSSGKIFRRKVLSLHTCFHAPPQITLKHSDMHANSGQFTKKVPKHRSQPSLQRRMTKNCITFQALTSSQMLHKEKAIRMHKP